jgi:8-oxo-dGTP pyrophosphatase MutT (NUDIX family)
VDDKDKRDFAAAAKRETDEEAKIDIEIREDCPVLVTNLVFFKWKTYFVRYEGKVERSNTSHTDPKP